MKWQSVYRFFDLEIKSVKTKEKKKQTRDCAFTCDPRWSLHRADTIECVTTKEGVWLDLFSFSFCSYFFFNSATAALFLSHLKIKCLLRNANFLTRVSNTLQCWEPFLHPLHVRQRLRQYIWLHLLQKSCMRYCWEVSLDRMDQWKVRLNRAFPSIAVSNHFCHMLQIGCLPVFLCCLLQNEGHVVWLLRKKWDLNRKRSNALPGKNKNKITLFDVRKIRISQIQSIRNSNQQHRFWSKRKRKNGCHNFSISGNKLLYFVKYNYTLVFLL